MVQNYSQELKKKTVEAVLSKSKKRKQAAEELGIPLTTLSYWIKGYIKGTGWAKNIKREYAKPRTDKASEQALEEELKQVRTENDSLHAKIFNLQNDFIKKNSAERRYKAFKSALVSLLEMEGGDTNG